MWQGARDLWLGHARCSMARPMRSPWFFSTPPVAQCRRYAARIIRAAG